jgi:hypothetical protein
MAQSMQALSAYGRAFDAVLVAAAVLAAAIALAAAVWLVAPGRYACWRRRRDERRYVRAGIEQLERYLTAAATTPARRPPGRPGRGRSPGSGT